ncbi:unnamed protein product, partial [Rotaria sordida]
IPNIPANARWKQNGVTVAGGHGWGTATNQLYNPLGLFVDDDQTMFIANSGNHRIIQWKMDDKNGQVVAGGNGKGNRLDQLNLPSDVLIDKETDSLIICDRGNQRVVRWSRRSGTTQGEILINNIQCWGLTMDDQRYLYISDTDNNEVRRYQIGDKNGTIVAGGNGKDLNMNSKENSSSLLEPNFDSTSSLDVTEASNSNISSNSSSINTNSFDCRKIKYLLLNQQQKFKIIENESRSHAEWWRSFGFPAQLNENKKFERIIGYISCFKCMHTQAYNSLSGTKRFTQHANKCFPSSTSSSISISSLSSTQTTLNQMGFKKSMQFSENDVKTVKKLCAEWICSDIRPFSIVDDPGFRNVAQECIRLGATFGNVDVNNVFRGEKTISRHIICVADELRDQVKDMLSMPLKEGSLTICPDYWTDAYKRISYLAVTVTFVTDGYSYQSIDLFCRQFHFKKKTAELTLNTLCKHLESFGIVSLANININTKKKKKTNSGNVLTDTTAVSLVMSIKAPVDITSPHESSSDETESSTDDDNNVETALPVTQRKIKKKLKKPISCKNELQISTKKITVDQIPPSAKRVLGTLNQCKRIVKYIKKAGINNDIKEGGGVTLHQSTIVRWLSMSNLLESILKSFTTTKRLLFARQKQALTTDLDEITIKQLVLVLKPFKHTMTLIQTGNIPSLHLVLLSTITLKETLSSYKSLINYKKCYCNTNENKKDKM